MPSVLVPCEYYPPATRAGGAARSISAIAVQEAENGRLEIVTRNRDLGGRQPFSFEATAAVDAEQPGVLITRSTGLRNLQTIWRRLQDVNGPEIIYLNSLFSRCYTLWPLLLMYTRIVRPRRIILAPRGELASSALATKPRRKRVASHLLKPALRGLDVTWHASSRDEAADVARFMTPAEPSIVVRADPAPAPSERLTLPINQELTLAFVGRMVPIKNFALLVRALQQLTIPVTAVVAGTLQDAEYWRSCVQLINKLPRNIAVEILDHVDHEAVKGLLRRSDALVLPTRGENFGHAIAEALSVGCPVFIPDTTLWTPLVAAGCGSLIDVDDPSVLAQELRALDELPVTDRNVRRRRAAAEYASWWSRTQEHAESLFDVCLRGRP